MAIVDATMTPAEFLLWEEAQDEKHEFLNGNIAVMPGVTWNHSLISSNVLAKIRQMVSGSQCHVVGSDLKVQVPGDGYLYPDVMVVCQPRFSDQKQNALLNPRLIFEILSESTEHRDRTETFDAYATIPSMAEYFLIASDERRVETTVGGSRSAAPRKPSAPTLLISP